MRYQDVLKKAKELRLARIRIRETFVRRPVRTAPRDREEREALIKLTELRWRRWRRTGKIEQLGPRRYRLHIDRMESDD